MPAPLHRRLRTPLVGLAFAALALPAGASAYVPGVGNGQRPTTDGPDLRSAEITGPGKSTVRFCFDAPVKPGIETSFRVRSYDAKRYWRGTSIQEDAPSGGTCLLVLFGTSLLQGTVAEVHSPDAATGLNGFGPAPSSEPLGGSLVTTRAGATSGPDLISVQQEGQSLFFEYDEPIVPLADTPENRARFGVEDQSSKSVVPPTAVVAPAPGDTTGTLVKATFSPAVASAAIMALSRAGAVTDTGHTIGGTTASPETEILVTGSGKRIESAGGGVYPVSAARSGARTVDVRFPVIVKSLSNAEFRAYSDDADVLVSTSVTPTGDGKGVIVDFGPDFADDQDSWVSVTTSPFAVESLNSTIGSGRTIAIGTAANQRPGYTAGPDLLSASIDGNQNVTYTFDEEVTRAPVPGARATLFHLQPLIAFNLITHSADAPPRREGLREIRVQHNTTSQQSVGASIRGWDPTSATVVITDPLLNVGPSSSVSYAVQQAPAPAPTATPVPVPVVVVPPAPTFSAGSTTLVRKILKKTKKTKKKKAQPYAVKYSGRLSSGSGGCIARRSITFVAKRKNGDIKTLGKATSNTKGAYALSLKSRPKGKVTVTVAERPGDFCAAISGGGINA